MFKYLLPVAAALSLTACSGLFDKDNTPAPSPLVVFKTEVNPTQLWSVKAGDGSNSENLKMQPAMNHSAVFVSSANGYVTSINKSSGQRNWQVNTKLPLTSGPGVGDGVVVVGSRNGNIIALSETNGTQAWKSSVQGEIIANPVVNDGTVLIKDITGHVVGLSTNDGHRVWSVDQVEPGLILRGSSSPAVSGNSAFVGFANGNLLKLGMNNGQTYWIREMATPEGAFTIQRMIDIDADPVIYDHRIFAATYQGRISSLEWTTGSVNWTHDISSYTGMAADDNHIFISDAKGYLWSFNADSGVVNWRQTKLAARVLSGPATIGNYVVVGDAEGYLHWLNKTDGHFAGRVSAGSGISASPLVENRVLYALTKNGYLVAYKL